MQKHSQKHSIRVKHAKTQLTQRQSPGHDLFNYMQQTTEEVARQYEQIQRRSREDSGTAGDQGEENLATLFRDWVPHPLTQERRDWFHAHRKAVKRATQARNRLKSFLSVLSGCRRTIRSATGASRL